MTNLIGHSMQTIGIKIICALVLLCFLVSLTGCKDNDKALVFQVGESAREEEDQNGQTGVTGPSGRPGATDATNQTGRADHTDENIEADPTGETGREDRPADTSLTDKSPEASQIVYVHVCGQVVTPGLYTLPEGSRVDDALKQAGGFTKEADTDYLNLAMLLTDGMKLYVPARDEKLPPMEENQGNTPGTYGDGEAMVNINRADVAELCTLSGIGESRAKDIITYRENHGGFAKIEDIMKVPGIKENVYMKIKDSICVE